MAPTDLQYPYTTRAQESARASQERGRFVQQVPVTDAFETLEPFQNELVIDKDGFIGFMNEKEVGNFEVVSRTKEVYNSLTSIISSGILDKLIGINNNIEFYYSYRYNTYIYPNKSLMFPKSYKYFSVHLNGSSDSILLSDRSAARVEQTNGKLPMVQKTPDDPDSFTYIPDFIVKNSTGLENGNMYIIRFYETNNGTDPIIAEKLFQIRVTSADAPSGTTTKIPISMRLTNTSVGTLKMKPDGNYVLYVQQRDDLTKIKFYGVVYYGDTETSKVVDYYYRDFVCEDPIIDQTVVTVKYNEGSVNLSTRVTVSVTANPNVDKLCVVTWLGSTTSPNKIYNGNYLVFASSANGSLFDVTKSVVVTENTGRVNFTAPISEAPVGTPGTFNMNYADEVSGTNLDLTISTDNYTVTVVTETTASKIHIPTSNDLENGMKYSAYIVKVFTPGTDYTDYCSFVTDTRSGAVKSIKVRYAGSDTPTKEQLKKLVLNSTNITGITDSSTFSIRVKTVNDVDVINPVTGISFASYNDDGIISLEQSSLTLRTPVVKNDVLIVEFIYNGSTTAKYISTVVTE